MVLIPWQGEGEPPRRGRDETPPQVVRLVPQQRTRTELLSCFSDLLNDADPDSLVPPEIAAEIGPFLYLMQDATCYRVVSQREAAHCWSHYDLMSNCMLVMEDLGFSSAWGTLLRTIRERTEESLDGSVLVSLVLCPPNSLVFRQLKETHAYVNLRSGNTWDLHLIGYMAINRFGTMRPSVLGIPTWRFSAGRFLDVIAHVQHEHAGALADSESAATGKPWRYSGTADLISFMAYRDYPELIDWPSLRAIQLLDAQGTYLDRSIGQIVEIMSEWRADGPEVREFAPGELRQTAASVLDLRRALVAVAGMVTSGVVGNAAYDLLKNLLR